MLTPDDLKKIRFKGRAHAEHCLVAMVNSGVSDAVAEAFGTGMIDGVRAFLAVHVSEKAAYEILQRAADRIGEGRVTGEPRRPEDAR